ncbi:molecular chaperone TorD family protein [Stappia sp. F7233]|uniref:Molecular chaperone TorD family protein n=1 Tax=Stappia albiluteola TaxID=2758565 RepID=A0A839AD86_9HYPH|nr:molecular chaperone TorD family protein [Stappia albiluteola]MBA5776609.1 molecular chaperone TorD family protein [Stappia albiluteola]
MTVADTPSQQSRSTKAPKGEIGQGGIAHARIADEDQDRAALYNLLGSALERPVGGEWLTAASRLVGGDGPLGEAIDALALAASRMSAQSAAREYQDLFIGIGRGELVPFGSYYLTGFLHEKPLALLRADMAKLGVERDPASKEPEDHAAALCQMMAGFIAGAFGPSLPLDEQKRFYVAHVGSWMPYFFRDLENAQSGQIYKEIGRIGRLFLEIEGRAFEMVN